MVPNDHIQLGWSSTSDGDREDHDSASRPPVVLALHQSATPAVLDYLVGASLTTLATQARAASAKPNEAASTQLPWQLNSLLLSEVSNRCSDLSPPCNRAS